MNGINVFDWRPEALAWARSGKKCAHGSQAAALSSASGPNLLTGPGKFL